MYDWLKDYRNIEIEIIKLENKITREKRELGRYSGGDLGGRILHEDSVSSSLEERIEAKEFELAHKMNDLFDIKRMVKRFDLVDHQILYGRYIEGKTFDEIADDLGYSKGTIYNKHAMLMKVVGYLQDFTAVE
ncbi:MULTISPECIES: hypothetical protein [unclassified Sporosarcina]|uniref:hypothetical protein n=1 Tax=unclassified Sporosarcina TaxID=2647733 RepID=UPI002041D350|nr:MULTISPECIES: hypothetical protein [unclassified Sporosarcina]GKV66711.1 hypothetical protein NCCP2331_28640 [Sporosarcina sp. NCCP-2331]GLB57106.1 hypothetical protein NCCP2378_28930 [Sporosarcina sp. NCCP-2378]